MLGIAGVVSDAEVIGRLVLACVCIALLIGVRWYQERQMAGFSGTGLQDAVTATGRGGRRPLRPLPANLSQLLYWLGLTTSAALAAQAIAAIVVGILR